MTSHFVETNGIRLHYLDFAESESSATLILLHGLTANAHCFDGLIAAGLPEHLRVIVPDLRGRGLSAKPETGYTKVEHAADILGLMDALDLEQVVLGGHSYGARLTMFMTAYHPERVQKQVLIDGGIMNPNVIKLILPSFERLDKVFPSWDAYITQIRASSYYWNGFWDDALEAYYRADVEFLSDGTVRPYPPKGAMSEAALKAEDVDWEAVRAHAAKSAIFIYTSEGLGPPGTPPVMTDVNAKLTGSSMPDCQLIKVSGNHMTMLFGEHAHEIVQHITAFVAA